MARKSGSGDDQDNGGQFRKGQMPHNARMLAFDSLASLIRHLGAEPRKVVLKGKEVEMSWAERSLRLTLDRAVKGNARDIAELLRLMTEHPQVTGRGQVRTVYVIRGAMANC